MVNDPTRFGPGTVLEYGGELLTVAHKAGELDPPIATLISEHGDYTEVPQHP